MPYICLMITGTFTYYEHFKEANKWLVYGNFVDGETYEIKVIDGKKYICGNFLMSYVLSGEYQNRVMPQGFRIDDTTSIKILKIIQQVEFKQIR